MNIEDINKKVEEIRAEARSYEDAHSDEDDLYIVVLQEIANNKENKSISELRAMAKCALKTREIKFPRHCA